MPYGYLCCVYLIKSRPESSSINIISTKEFNLVKRVCQRTVRTGNFEFVTVKSTIRTLYTKFKDDFRSNE